MHYDSSGVVVGVWVGRNLWRLVRPRRGDACGCRRTFLKGVGYTPPLTALLRTGGNPRTSPGNSGVVVASFLKVLLGTRRFGCWERGGTSPEGAAVAGRLRSVDLPLLAFVSLSFFSVFYFVEEYNYDYPCSLGINHGGFFVGQGSYRSYCNGKTAWYDYVPSGKLTMSELEMIVEDLGYEMAGRLDVYWCLPGLQIKTGGLRKMNSQEACDNISACVVFWT